MTGILRQLIAARLNIIRAIERPGDITLRTPAMGAAQRMRGSRDPAADSGGHHSQNWGFDSCPSLSQWLVSSLRGPSNQFCAEMA